MININIAKTQWEAISTPKKAIVRQFISKNKKSFCEVILPDVLPTGMPNIQGWHFCMPVGCIKEEKNGSMRISFPPNWTTIRFSSPFEQGKLCSTKELPITEALAMMRKSYAI